MAGQALEALHQPVDLHDGPVQQLPALQQMFEQRLQLAAPQAAVVQAVLQLFGLGRDGAGGHAGVAHGRVELMGHAHHHARQAQLLFLRHQRTHGLLQRGRALAYLLLQLIVGPPQGRLRRLAHVHFLAQLVERGAQFRMALDQRVFQRRPVLGQLGILVQQLGPLHDGVDGGAQRRGQFALVTPFHLHLTHAGLQRLLQIAPQPAVVADGVGDDFARAGAVGRLQGQLRVEREQRLPGLGTRAFHALHQHCAQAQAQPPIRLHALRPAALVELGQILAAVVRLAQRGLDHGQVEQGQSFVIVQLVAARHLQGQFALGQAVAPVRGGRAGIVLLQRQIVGGRGGVVEQQVVDGRRQVRRAGQQFGAGQAQLQVHFRAKQHGAADGLHLQRQLFLAAALIQFAGPGHAVERRVVQPHAALYPLQGAPRGRLRHRMMLRLGLHLQPFGVHQQVVGPGVVAQRAHQDLERLQLQRLGRRQPQRGQLLERRGRVGQLETGEAGAHRAQQGLRLRFVVLRSNFRGRVGNRHGALHSGHGGLAGVTDLQYPTNWRRAGKRRHGGPQQNVAHGLQPGPRPYAGCGPARTSCFAGNGWLCENRRVLRPGRQPASPRPRNDTRR